MCFEMQCLVKSGSTKIYWIISKILSVKNQEIFTQLDSLCKKYDVSLGGHFPRLAMGNSLNEDSANLSEPPNFCNECEHRSDCHAGFEETNGIGFYPFTPKALKQMLHRVNSENFNPRILIKDVLKYTLENSIDERG